MIIQSDFLTEGLFGQILIWMLETLPYIDSVGWRPTWIIRTRNYGQPPTFNIVPSIIRTTYGTDQEPGAITALEDLKARHGHDFRGDFALAYRYWHSHFRFTEDVYQRVAHFYDRNLEDKTSLGVHYRGTDKNNDLSQTNPVSHADFLCALNDFLRTHKDVTTLFVASDDHYFVDRIMKNVPNRCCLTFHRQDRSKDSLPLFTRHPISQNVDMAKDAIVDCLTLSCCRYVLSSMSALSAFAKVLNPNLKIWRIAACKPSWFPVAYIEKYGGYGSRARGVLRALQEGDCGAALTGNETVRND
jgi:hypothetical protein